MTSAVHGAIIPSTSKRRACWPWILAVLALNALDLSLTHHLVETGGAYEANPVGSHILRNYGWWGLTVLKACSVLIVLGIGLVLYRRQRPRARLLLQITCAILTTVVGYSAVVAASQADSLRQLDQVTRIGRKLEDKRYRLGLYYRKVDEISRQLFRGHTTLAQATRELARFFHRVRPTPYFHPQDLQGPAGLERYLAAHLLRKAGALLQDHPDWSKARLQRLRAEFTGSYHAAAPDVVWAPAGHMVETLVQ